MSGYEETLEVLAGELCSAAELAALEAVLAPEFNFYALIYLDLLMGGPGIAAVDAAKLAPQDGPDYLVFRPLWYCDKYFLMFPIASWTTRSVVHMSGLHLESLAKRVGGEWTQHLPLGRLVRERRVERAVGVTAAEQLRRFTPVYNAAKHELPGYTDRHLFSQRDAVRAYVVSRKLAKALYPHAKLTVEPERFSVS